MANELDVVLKAVARDLALEFFAVSGAALVISREHRDPIGKGLVLLQYGQRIDNDGLALPTGQAGGVEDHALIGFNAPGTAKRVELSGRRGGEIEFGGIDAAMNDAQTRVGRAVAGVDKGSGKAEFAITRSPRAITLL